MATQAEIMDAQPFDWNRRNPEHWGRHTSLYTSVDTESTRRLERAIKCYTTGHFSESTRIFDNSVFPPSATTLLALEKALSLERRGCRIEAAQCLRDLLEVSEDGQVVPTLATLHLVRIKIAQLELTALGKAAPALLQVRALREWLAMQHISDYNDIMVRIWFLLLALIAIRLTLYSSIV